MSFDARITVLAERLLSTRAFELIVAPALADLQFERESRRAGGGRLAVLRALAGGLAFDARGSAGVFLKVSLLSVSYFMFPVAVSVTIYQSWAEFFAVASVMLVLSMTPVVICFWPARPPVE